MKPIDNIYSPMRRAPQPEEKPFTVPVRVRAAIPEMGYANTEGLIARVLFCKISQGHLRDQHFSSEVRWAAQQIAFEIKKNGIIKFDKFIKIICSSKLSKYGTKTSGNIGWRTAHSVLNLKWWQKVWEYIRHNREVKIQWISDPDPSKKTEASMKTMFAIGKKKITRGGEEFGMTHGPHPSEKEMLDYSGAAGNEYILKLFEDGTHQELWRWDEKAAKWVRNHPRVINKKSLTDLADIDRSGLEKVYIGRGSKWGNPFVVGKDGNRDEVILKYSEYLLEQDNLLAALPELENKMLECFCSPLACHGDILIELANPIVDIPVPLLNEEKLKSGTMMGQADASSAATYGCSQYMQDSMYQGLNRNPTDAYHQGFRDGAAWAKAEVLSPNFDDDIPF